MKKRVLFSLSVFTALIAHADISFYKSGKSLFANFICNETDSITYESVKADYNGMVQAAADNKCKTLIVCYADGNVFYMTDVKSNLSYPDVYFKKIDEAIHSYEETIKTGGELIRIEKHEHHEPAKYIQEDYINGKLSGTFESEWNAGPFKESRSTYTTSDGDVYLSITRYEPPVNRIDREEIYSPTKYEKVLHMERFRDKFYKIESHK